MPKVFLIGGEHIAKYTIAPVLWKIISEQTKTGFDYDVVPLKNDEEFSHWVSSIKADPEVKGFNIALPWKEKILEHVQERDNFTRSFGITNSIKVNKGSLYSFNTDYYGVARPYEKNFGPLFRKRILILGAGGAGRSLAYYLTGIPEAIIAIFDVQTDKLKEINNLQIRQLNSYQEVGEYIKDADLVVNASPIGKLYFDKIPDEFSTPISFDLIKSAKKSAVFQEMNYYPLSTQLLSIARELGYPVIEGTKMLTYQAVKTFEILFDTKVDDYDLNEIINHLENYVYGKLPRY